MKIDAVLLIGFGGPEKPEEVIPFLQDVVRHAPVPRERLEKVAGQYAQIGSISPFNRLIRAQASALEKLLASRGVSLPVHIGLAHSEPRIAAKLAEFSEKGLTDIFAIIMAPHRSPASFIKYLLLVDEALEGLKSQGKPVPTVTYAPEWHDRTGFIHAIEQNVKAAYAQLTAKEKERNRAELIFTTHSIPRPMSNTSSYMAQFEETAARVTERVGMPYYQTAFTSRSGKPDDPWLEPDLGDFIELRAKESLNACVVAPIGFLVDHVEVLYDIDTLAQEKAKRVGVHMVRAKTVGTHPSFIGMLASLVEEALA